MAIRSLKTGQFSRSALVGNPVIMPGSYESIATVSVGSGGASSVEFTSIPGTYTHLQIRAICKNNSTSTGDDSIAIQFNSDTGSNYSGHALYGSGSAVSAFGSANMVNGYAGLCNRSNASFASMFTTNVIDILDYANTNKYKTVRSLGGADQNGSGGIIFNSGNWRSTSAVTSIKLFISGQNFVQYSHFALYGVN